MLRCCRTARSRSTAKKVDDRPGSAARLKEIYDPRPEKIIFVKGDPAVKYQEVVFAMDVARGAGVKVIGVPPEGHAGLHASEVSCSEGELMRRTNLSGFVRRISL